MRRVKPDLVGPVAGRLLTESATQRIEDGQALADQAGGHLAEAVGAVQDVDVRALQPDGRLLDDLRELLDHHPVEGDAVVRGGGVGLDLHPLGLGLASILMRSASASAGLTTSATSCCWRSSAARWASSVWARQDLLLACAWASGPAWAASACARSTSALYWAWTIAVCRAYSACLRCRLLLRLRGGLVGLGLGDLRLPLDGRDVRGGHRVDVAGSMSSIDWICSESIVRPILSHLGRRGVEDRRGQLLPLGDDLLDGHRADDRAQVAGEDPAGQHRHLRLVGQETLPGVDDALGVVADLEGDDGSTFSEMPCRVTQVSVTSDSRMASDRNRTLRKTGTTNAPWPVTTRKGRVALGPLAAGDQHRLVGCGHSVTEHVLLCRYVLG